MCSKHSSCWLLLQLWVLSTSEYLSRASQKPGITSPVTTHEKFVQLTCPEPIKKTTGKKRCKPCLWTAFMSLSYPWPPFHNFPVSATNKQILQTQALLLHHPAASLDNKKLSNVRRPCNERAYYIQKHWTNPAATNIIFGIFFLSF